MYASVCRHPKAESPDEWTKACRSLSARLGKLPGFVAYLLLEQLDGGCVTISIFESRDGLADAAGLIAAGLAGTGAAAPNAHPDFITGEVIVQRGL